MSKLDDKELDKWLATSNYRPSKLDMILAQHSQAKQSSPDTKQQIKQLFLELVDSVRDNSRDELDACDQLTKKIERL